MFGSGYLPERRKEQTGTTSHGGPLVDANWRGSIAAAEHVEGIVTSDQQDQLISVDCGQLGQPRRGNGKTSPSWDTRPVGGAHEVSPGPSRPGQYYRTEFISGYPVPVPVPYRVPGIIWGILLLLFIITRHCNYNYIIIINYYYYLFMDNNNNTSTKCLFLQGCPLLVSTLTS